jgi:uncharacterized ion transporter superfamily protein YfcC
MSGDNEMNTSNTQTDKDKASPPVQDRFPTAYTILFALIAVMAALTWILPAGQYQRVANEALGKDAPVPGTYQVVEASHQGVLDVLMAPITGFYNQSTGMANAIDVSFSFSSSAASSGW